MISYVGAIDNTRKNLWSIQRFLTHAVFLLISRAKPSPNPNYSHHVAYFKYRPGEIKKVRVKHTDFQFVFTLFNLPLGLQFHPPSCTYADNFSLG